MGTFVIRKNVMLFNTARAIRQKKIDSVKSEKFDLLVIGGGITGAGIALDAASRGIKTVLIEKNDYASGTSSKSTKLIHGGLRYLKNFEFGLVREVGHEREIVWRNAPHLVHPEKMLLPITKDGSLSKISASAAIYLYDYLAGVKASERRKMLRAADTLKIEPALNPEGLTGAALYTEYRTDDARLTIELIKTATQYGATAINYVKAQTPIYENGKIAGFEVRDEFSGELFSVQAAGVINAAGPWVDEIRQSDKSLQGKHLKLSKGVHLVFPFKKLPINQSVYIDVKGDKGRMVFVIPRGRAVYAGTTDTFYEDVDHPNVSKEDVTYILNAVNAMFPSAKLKVSDVESTWSGLRPLIMEEGKSASELSRKDELFISPSGMVSIAGGKLTGYRKMAERSIDAWLNLHSGLKQKLKPGHTQHILLSGADFGNRRVFLENLRDTCGQIPNSMSLLEDLFEKYGSNTQKIVDLAYDLYNENRDLTHPLFLAELVYAIEDEHVATLSDFFVRRTGMLYFNRQKITEIRKLLDPYFQSCLGFDTVIFEKLKSDFDKDYQEVLNFH